MKKQDVGVDSPSLNKNVNQYNTHDFWPYIICDEVIWFRFGGVMMHAAKTMKYSSEIL